MKKNNAKRQRSRNTDRIVLQDRDWFDLRPGKNQRTRPPAAGEFWPMFDSANVHRPETGRVR